MKSKDFRLVWKTVSGQPSSSYRLDCRLGTMNAIPMETRAAEHQQLQDQLLCVCVGGGGELGWRVRKKVVVVGLSGRWVTLPVVSHSVS